MNEIKYNYEDIKPEPDWFWRICGECIWEFKSLCECPWSKREKTTSLLEGKLVYYNACPFFLPAPKLDPINKKERGK